MLSSVAGEKMSNKMSAEDIHKDLFHVGRKPQESSSDYLERLRLQEYVLKKMKEHQESSVKLKAPVKWKLKKVIPELIKDDNDTTN